VTLRTARAIDHPCVLYAHSAPPKPTRTQWHHRFPEYLQRKVWGHTRFEDDEHMMWLCGLCHDSVHDWIAWLLGEARKPVPEPGWNAKREAENAVAMYRSALDSLQTA
jgi:hypothetical protein